MRRAQVSDLGPITAFLTDHAPRAMFPLNNLLRYGFEGDDPFSVRFWIRTQDHQVTDVLTLTTSGMAMPCLPSGDYASAAARLANTALTGIIGPRPDVRGLETALGLTQAPRTLDVDEPHFLLDLSALTVPQGPGNIVPLADAPEPLITAWMLDYQLQTLHTPATEAHGRVADSYARYRRDGSHVVLMDGAAPLAMTGFNATAPGIVQVGGVYTPPGLRGRGHARRALGLHLQHARGAGIAQATLFSASDSAAAAYRALGFTQIGDWTLLLFHGPKIGAVPNPSSVTAP